MKFSKRVAAFISAGALAFGMLGVVGCSSSNNAENTAPKTITTADINAQDITVTGVGFSVVDNSTVNYAFTVTNPNNGYIADGVTFTIEGYAEDGTMLIGGGETIQEIYPGVETAAAGTAFLPEDSPAIARFEVQPLMEHVNWTETTMTAEEIENMFQLSDVQATQEGGNMLFTGVVSADLGENTAAEGEIPTNRQDVRLVVILRDAEGNILGGGSSMGIMLDPTMNQMAAVPPEDAATNAEAAEPAPSESTGEESTVAKSSFTINITGAIPYVDYTIVATPGF